MSFKKSLVSIILLVAVFVSACATNAESTIATSVALTVQAQNNDQPTALPASATSAPVQVTALPTLTPLPQSTSTTAPISGADTSCARASLVDESPPDGTIFAPAEVFLKKWYIRNDSTCVWSTAYKIVFINGEQMGGAYVYPLPQSVLPGDTIEIPLQLIAPAEVGSHTGYWKLQTPEGVNFGVGQYSEAFYVQVDVSTDPKPAYGITSVVYSLERSPLAGCATNVIYTIYATISVSGKTTVKARWEHSDGGGSSLITLQFDEAGSQQISDVWSIRLGSSNTERWTELVTTAPTKQRFGKQTFSYLCQ